MDDIFLEMKRNIRSFACHKADGNACLSNVSYSYLLLGWPKGTGSMSLDSPKEFDAPAIRPWTNHSHPIAIVTDKEQ